MNLIVLATYLLQIRTYMFTIFFSIKFKELHDRTSCFQARKWNVAINLTVYRNKLLLSLMLINI